MKEIDEQVKKQLSTDESMVVEEQKNMQQQAQNQMFAPQQTQQDTVQKQEKKQEDTPVDLQKMGFSEKLLSSLALLAEDKNKASEYFKPVVESANKVLTGCKSRDELAGELGALMDRVFYYLDNRPASMFSSQRKARRAACEDLISNVGRFLYDADDVFADQVRLKVTDAVNREEKSPKAKEKKLQKAQQFATDYGYVISFDAIESKLARETIMGGDFKATGKDVSAIRHYMEGLKAIMTNTMPPVPQKDATAEEKKAYEDEIKMTGFGISKMYQGIIDACNNFLSDETMGIEEKKIVGDLLKGYEHDSKVFFNGISEYVAGNKEKGTATWADAVATKGSTGIQLRSSAVTKMGAGSSVVYKYNAKGKNLYFKEEEKNSTNAAESWTKVYSKKKEMAGYDPAFEKELAKFEDVVQKQFERVKDLNYADMGNSKEYKELYLAFLRTLRRAKPKTYSLKAKQMPKEVLERYPLIDYLAKLDQKSDATAFIDTIMDDFIKGFNSDVMCTRSCKIDAGNPISSRNVATSRMADLLGISNMVLRSQTAEVMNGNKVVVGNVMEEAPGKEANVMRKNPNFKYNNKTVSQICAMQVFDLICGQIDRNTSNYFLTVDGMNITGVKMIDNDLSFGKLTTIGKGEKATGRMIPINDEVIDALPTEFVSSIKKLNTYSAEDLGFFFGDILKKDELAALKTRIGIVYDSILEREAVYKRLRESGTDEEKDIASHMDDDNFRAVYFQYKVYWMVEEIHQERVQSGKKPYTDKEDIDLLIKSSTYLNFSNMKDYDDVVSEYDRYIK